MNEERLPRWIEILILPGYVMVLTLIGACDHIPPPEPLPTRTASPSPGAETPTPEPTPTAAIATPTVPVPTPAAVGLIGYSLPNGWHLQNPADFARLLGENHATVTQMDWTPYIGSPNVCSDAALTKLRQSKSPEAKMAATRSTNATYPSAALALVNELRKWHVTALINVANMNGCATTSQGDAWFEGQVSWIRSNIGPDGVILYPVSEPWAFEPQGKSKRWTEAARSLWPAAKAATGLFAIPDAGANSYTGRPFWPSIPYDDLTVHYCDSGKLVDSLGAGDVTSISTTDCSAILNPGPTVAAEWTKLAVDHKSNLVIYDFSASAPDVATVQAMGAQMPAAPTPVPTATPVCIPPGGPTPVPTCGSPQPTMPPATPVPAPENITFLDDPTVGGWPETSRVTNTTISNPNVQGPDQYGEVCIYHSKAGVWPITGGPDGRVEGNPWFVAKVNGQWYASTYEWLGPGTVCRSIAFGIWGKYSQFSQVQAWHPQPGEQIGLFVSTVARPGVPPTANERSNIVWLNWPAAAKAQHHKAWKRP